MSSLRVLPRLNAIAMVSLFACAFWMRTTSLESLPEVSGDEVWHAIQIKHIAEGKPYKLWTATDLPLSPIHSMLELPYLFALKPSLWMVRLPGFIVGTLAVALTYVFARRMFDRTTATIASALLAVLPLAIIYSRVSYEVSSSPLFGIIAIYLAYQVRVKALVTVLPLCYFVHPTTIFLFPEILGIVLARTLAESVEPSAGRLRLLLRREAPLVGVGVALGLYTMMRPATRRMSQTFDSGLFGRHDLPDFLSSLEHMYFGDARSIPIRSVLFWASMILLLGFGLRRLIRARDWGRVAIAAAPPICAFGLFVMAGSNILDPGMFRYGLFLAVPTVLSVSCLLRTFVPEPSPSEPRRRRLRHAQFAAMLVVGWALLLGFDLTRLNRWAFIPVKGHKATESPWSFESDGVSLPRRVSQIIKEDLATGIAPGEERGAGVEASTPRSRVPVLAEDWPRYGPIEWLLTDRPEVNVFDYHDLGDQQQPKIDRLLDRLGRGGYALCFPKAELDSIMRVAYPPAMRRHWDIMHRGERYATLMRLNRVVPVPGDYDGDGKVEMAAYRTDTSEWIIPSLGPRPIRYGEPGLDVPVPGDYNGDGKTEIAVYRTSTGVWHIPTHDHAPVRYGEPNQDVPVPADYDGDGRTDIATFRVRTCEWFVSSLNSVQIRIPSKPGYSEPVPADYDGDGKTDFAIFRTDTGEWFIPCLGPAPLNLGVTGRDVPVPHDHDGDRRADLAVYRPATGEWFLRSSIDGSIRAKQLGNAVIDQPVPADYDGDGKAEIAIYRPTTAESFVQVEGDRLIVTQIGPQGREPASPAARPAAAGEGTQIAKKPSGRPRAN